MCYCNLFCLVSVKYITKEIYMLPAYVFTIRLQHVSHCSSYKETRIKPVSITSDRLLFCLVVVCLFVCVLVCVCPAALSEQHA